MKRVIILFLLCLFNPVLGQVTSYYYTHFKIASTGQLLSGYSGYIYLVPEGSTYPTGAITLYNVSGKDNEYYATNVADGNYDVYIDFDKSGPNVPTLTATKRYVAENRLSQMADTTAIIAASYFLQPNDETSKIQLNRYESPGITWQSRWNDNVDKIDAHVLYADPVYFNVKDDTLKLNSNIGVIDTAQFEVTTSIADNDTTVPTGKAILTHLNVDYITASTITSEYASKELLADSLSDLRAAIGNSIHDTLSNFLLPTMNVSTTLAADGINKFNTVQSAVDAWMPGRTILLGSETFNERVVISDSGLTIKGISRDLSKVNKLAVTGKNCLIESFTLIDSLIINRSNPAEWNWVHLQNSFVNMKFYGDVNLGLPGIQLLYPFEFNNCEFLGSGKNIYFNNYNGQYSNYFKNSYINGWDGTPCDTVSPSAIDIYVEEGGCTFDGGRIYLDTLYFADPDTMSIVTFTNMAQCWFGTISMTTSTAQFRTLFLKYGFYLFEKDILFQGKFEFDIEFAQINMLNHNWVWNSIANSRFFSVQQLGWNSTSTITGAVGALDNLFVFHSTFGMAAPEGLGANTANSWNSFIDY